MFEEDNRVQFINKESLNMFEEGNRVKFTNKGSWNDDSNGAIGTVIGTTYYGAYVVEFDEPVSDIGMGVLCVCDDELTLIEK